MARSRPRWQMTTRSRFAIILGFAALAVAGVQLAVLSDPPTVLQMVVVAFWSVVGVAYLGSAVAQRIRARRRPAPGSPVASPPEEIVPVPVRPARPRARTGAGTGAGTGAEDGADARSDPTTRTGSPSSPATRRSPVGAPAATEAVPPAAAAAAVPPASPVPPAAPVPPVPPLAPETSRVAIRARRTGETGPRATPVAAGPVTTAAPATPVPAAQPTPAPAPGVPAAAPVTAASPVPAPVPARPVAAAPRPSPLAPAPEETTDAFTVRAAPTPPRRPTGDQPALSGLAGVDSPLSFGPTRGRTVAAGSGSETRRPRPTPPPGRPRVGVPTPPPLPEPTRDPSDPLPVAAGTGPAAHRVGAHAAAPEGAVPAPRARHRADVEDPVAARRGGGDGGGGRRVRGRHASTEAPSAAARGGR